MRQPALVTDRIGQVVSDYDAIVDVDSVRAFAAATTGTRPTLGHGDPAPPLYVVVPTRTAVMAALRAVVPEAVSRAVPVLHGEQFMSQIRPLRCGESVRVVGRPMCVHPKRTGTLVGLAIDTHDADGDLLSEQDFRVFLPHWHAADAVGPQLAAPVTPAASGPSHVVRSSTTSDQSRRYADASGDMTAFHIDDDRARASGFSGVIMHGLCSLAIAVDAVARAAGHPPENVRQLAVRFATPAYPGEDIVTTWWSAEDGRFGFESRNPRGESLLALGAIQIGSPS